MYDSDGDGCDDCSNGIVSSGTNITSPDTADDGDDYDGDGECDAGDNDDDNDNICDSGSDAGTVDGEDCVAGIDAVDACPQGETGWTTSSSTDYDGDGCQDSSEDTDDDEDSVADSSDSCDQDSGVVSQLI